MLLIKNCELDINKFLYPLFYTLNEVNAIFRAWTPFSHVWNGQNRDSNKEISAQRLSKELKSDWACLCQVVFSVFGRYQKVVQVRSPAKSKRKRFIVFSQGPAWHHLLLLLYFHRPLPCLIFGHLSPALCPPGWSPPSLPPLLYSINLSIRHVDYIRDYRLKGIPFHLSLSLSALHLPLSLYRPSALTRPSSSVTLTHTRIYTHICSRISCFSLFPWCHLISHTAALLYLHHLHPPYQPASFRPCPLLSQLLLLCLSTPPPISSLVSSLHHSPSPPSLTFFPHASPRTIIIGTMMLNQSHAYPGWQICYRGGNRCVIPS